MGSRYLTDLADCCRAAGLRVQEYPGWQSRARSSGGYNSGCPTHVMVHHTASSSSWDGQRDADYIATGDSDAPLSNLYIDRSGLVWVIAAGATNTNGKGSDWWGGGVPDNSMNSYAIGIEAGNNGTGEVWSSALLASYRTLVSALCSRYAIPIARVRAHWEWTNRKIDPAGNSPYASGGASWNMDAFRADCGQLPPAPTGDDMAVLIRGSGDTYYAWNGVQCAGVPSLDLVSLGVANGLYPSPDPQMVADDQLAALLEQQAPR